MRSSALRALSHGWREPETRRILSHHAVHDPEHGCRSNAVRLLVDQWPDETTRELLEDRALQDENEWTRGAAIQVLAENWPDETTRKLLADRSADADLTEEQRGEHGVALGKLHSEFGRIVLTSDLDGLAPYLDLREPVARDHIAAAAEQADISADEIEETVRSLSEHLGWDITRGLGE